MSLRRLCSLALFLPAAAFARAPMAPPPALPPETQPAPARTVAALPSVAADASVYSIDGTSGPPTDEETLYLEYINRARRDPAGEGARLRNTDDAEVTSTYNQFRVDLAKMESEFQAIPPVPPLAFNAKLLNAARAHTQDMFDHAYQGHTGSDSSTIGTRAAAAGYTYNIIAENVFSYSESVFYGHAGFEVDWGPEADGMQTGRGHRVNIHNASAREVGIGLVNGTNTLNGNTVGPQVVTQDFGKAQSVVPLLTGVAYFDFSGDNFYSVGEGIGNVTVTVAGANYSAITSPSGAFTVPLPGSGTYAVTFSGLGFSQTTNVTSTSSENVKLDFTPAYARPVLTGATSVTTGAPTPYAFTSVAGATGYNVVSYVRDSSAASENAESLANVTLDVTSGYSVLQTGTKSQGSSAFNLRHPVGDNQYLTLNRLFYVRSGASLSFASRITIATPTEIAKVQISTDDGVTWTDLYTQNGPGQPGETSFITRNVNLAAYANQLCRVRFVYAATGQYYPGPGSTPTIGWYIDAINFTNTDVLTNPASNALAASATSFNYTAPAAGSYLLTLVPKNVTRNLPGSEALLLTASAFTGTAPSITTQPAGASVTAGAAVTLSVTAAGTAPFSYQWKKGGANIAGATSSTLALSNATAADSGNYTVTVSNGGGSVTSDIAAVLVRASADDGTGNYLSNVSVRAGMTQGQTLIMGFVVANGAKPILVRAGGPVLNQFGLTGIPDPRLTLYDKDGVSVATNDDWPLSLKPDIDALGATPFAEGSKDAALLQSLTGPHTAHAQGTGSGSIIAEAYDAGSNNGPRLANISARYQVGTGANILIAGFVVGGSGSMQVLVRAVGPGLVKFGVTGTLVDPKVEVYDGGTQIAANNDWSASLANTFQLVGAGELDAGSKDAALVLTLSAGRPYTVQVSGVGGTTGEALVEVYAIP